MVSKVIGGLIGFHLVFSAGVAISISAMREVLGEEGFEDLRKTAKESTSDNYDGIRFIKNTVKTFVNFVTLRKIFK